jgi:uncharacterized UPF0146 family protein
LPPPRSDRPVISYVAYREGWPGHLDRIHRLIEDTGATRVCDVGGGANPAVALDYIARTGLSYVLLDASESELAKAPSAYTKVVADICAPTLEVEGEFDLVITRMVAEHVSDPLSFHRNVRSLLNADGRVFHFFPTLYSLPFVLNRVLPSSLSDRILGVIQSGRDPTGSHGKFPVYYRWCRGPTRRQIRRLEAVGYIVEEYVGLMGHGYFRKLPPLQAVVDFLTDVALKWPTPAITSYSWVVLKRAPFTGEAAGA